MHLMVNDKTGEVDVAASVRGMFAALSRGYHEEKPAYINLETEQGYTSIFINGYLIAHIDKRVDGKFLTIWAVPSVNRVEYTDSKENAVKTIMGAFGM